MFSLTLVSILTLMTLSLADELSSTETFTTSSLEQQCSTIMTDKSVKSISTALQESTTTFLPFITTSTISPSTVTITPSPIIFTSTIEETLFLTATASQIYDEYSTTLTSFSTITAVNTVIETITETSSFLATDTVVSTSMIPTSSGFLPIASTFPNKGVYGNSSPAVARAVSGKRDSQVWARENATLAEKNYDDWDCTCEPPEEFPAVVDCTNWIGVYPTMVYFETQAAKTTTLPIATSTELTTLTVSATSTVILPIITQSNTLTLTTLVTTTSLTTSFITQTQISTLRSTRTTAIHAACTRSPTSLDSLGTSPNYLGPIIPEINPWGNDYASLSASPHLLLNTINPSGGLSSYECCAACQENPLCALSTYGLAGGMCYLWKDMLCAAGSHRIKGQAGSSLSLTATSGNELFTQWEFTNGNCGFVYQAV